MGGSLAPSTSSCGRRRASARPVCLVGMKILCSFQQRWRLRMSFSFVKALLEHSSCRAPAPSSSAPVTVSLSPNPNAPLCFVLLLLLYFTVAILSLPLYYYGSASVCFWRLYFVGALLADGDAKSNDGCRLAGPSSFGASSPQRVLDGGTRHPDVPQLVLSSA